MRLNGVSRDSTDLFTLRTLSFVKINSKYDMSSLNLIRSINLYANVFEDALISMVCICYIYSAQIYINRNVIYIKFT